MPSSKSTKRRSEEEERENVQPSKKAKVAPARPGKKGKGKGRVVVDSDDSDSAFEEEPKEAPKAAPVPKKTAKPRARNKKAVPVVEDLPPAQIIKVFRFCAAVTLYAKPWTGKRCTRLTGTRRDDFKSRTIPSTSAKCSKCTCLQIHTCSFK
jgi:hypothetical protein